MDTISAQSDLAPQRGLLTKLWAVRGSILPFLSRFAFAAIAVLVVRQLAITALYFARWWERHGGHRPQGSDIYIFNQVGIYQATILFIVLLWVATLVFPSKTVLKESFVPLTLSAVGLLAIVVLGRITAYLFVVESLVNLIDQQMPFP